jgi:hypothetical protein
LTGNSSSIPDSNSDPIIRAYIQEDNLVIELVNRELRTKFDVNDFDKSVKALRDILDVQTDDIELKEKIILFVSKNWSTILKKKQNYKVQSLDEWKIGLERRYQALKKAIDENMPTLWEAMEFQLAVKSILNIKDCTLPFAGIILGPPSSSKTVGIEMFRGTANTFYTDSFSAKSFVSHNTSVPREKLQEIDLLPKIKDKIFLSPELSPTFSKKDDELIEILGIFIRVLDGKGYESDTGAHGHRGYVGEFMFVWIGAAVEIPKKVHKYLSTLGPKLYFFRLPKTEKSEDEYLEQFEGEEFGIKFEKIHEKVTDYLEWFNKYPGSHPSEPNTGNYETPLVKVEWNKEKDDKKAFGIVIKLAKILAHLRGTLITWETRETQGTDYDYSLPIIEEPDRAITQLRNLARGHALSQGRNYITMTDIPLLIKVVLSTASIERVKVFDLLIKSGSGQLSTSQITSALEVSNSTAKRTMVEFKGIGIVSLSQQGDYDNSEKIITLKPKFKWFLTEEFLQLREGHIPEAVGAAAPSTIKMDHFQNSPELQEKTSPGTTSSNENETIFECYYCNEFTPTNDELTYKRHIVLEHPGRLAYPTELDLKKLGIKPKGKKWEH